MNGRMPRVRSLFSGHKKSRAGQSRAKVRCIYRLKSDDAHKKVMDALGAKCDSSPAATSETTEHLALPRFGYIMPSKTMCTRAATALRHSADPYSSTYENQHAG